MRLSASSEKSVVPFLIPEIGPQRPGRSTPSTKSGTSHRLPGAHYALASTDIGIDPTWSFQTGHLDLRRAAAVGLQAQTPFIAAANGARIAAL